MFRCKYVPIHRKTDPSADGLVDMFASEGNHERISTDEAAQVFPAYG